MTHHNIDQDQQEPKVRIQLEEEVFTQYSLVGRRTTVYNITTFPEISDRPLVLKMSMQECHKTPEHELLLEAEAKGVDNLPKAHLWSDSKTEWRLSNGPWGSIFPDNEDDSGAYEDRCQRFVIFTKYIPIEDVISVNNLHALFSQLIDCESWFITLRLFS